MCSFCFIALPWKVRVLLEVPIRFQRSLTQLQTSSSTGSFPGAEHESDPSPRHRIDNLFEQILSKLSVGESNQGSSSHGSGSSSSTRDLVLELQRILTPSTGVQPRKRGGFEYKPNHIRNAVLLADNLRPVPNDEGDFLKAVTLQTLE